MRCRSSRRLVSGLLKYSSWRTQKSSMLLTLRLKMVESRAFFALRLPSSLLYRLSILLTCCARHPHSTGSCTWISSNHVAERHDPAADKRDISASMAVASDFSFL